MTTARKALDAARAALARHLDEAGFGAADYDARCACARCRSTRVIALIDAALAVLGRRGTAVAAIKRDAVAPPYEPPAPERGEGER